MSLRIATYNIRRGGRERVSILGSVIRAIDADVTVLQEATDPHVVQDLADASGSRVYLHGPGRSVAVLGRSAAVQATWHPWGGGHGLAEVELRDHDVRLLGVHLTAGLSARGERRRAVEADRVLEVIARAPYPTRTVIAGDFNAIAPGDVLVLARLPAWIRILLRFDGGIGTAVVGRLLAEGFTDAYRRRNPTGPGATMPATAPTVRLDYFLLGRAVVPMLVGCAIPDLDPARLRTASDHLPVVLDLDPTLRPLH